MAKVTAKIPTWVGKDQMTTEQAIKAIRATKAKMIVPKGVAGELVRFVARTFEGQDMVWGACPITDFASINAGVMKR